MREAVVRLLWRRECRQRSGGQRHATVWRSGGPVADADWAKSVAVG